ncbi:12-oxophytodienoate reductase [Rhodococcus sp. 14C212]|nr:12-oxophytodienoate reductase [Rhodococcus sp. 14C212]
METSRGSFVDRQAMSYATVTDEEETLDAQRDLAVFNTPADLGGGLTVRNRFALAPMTRLKSVSGVPTEVDVDYYRRRAAADVGLILTEGVHVRDPAAGFSPRVPHMYGDDAAAGWRRIVDAVHAEGTAIMPQLWHAGAVRGTEYERGPETETVSPSGLDLAGAPVGRSLTVADIEGAIENFVESALVAKDAGFDGIELHGAHGYLFDQFLWPRTNRRTDRYGLADDYGTRFSVETITAIRAAVGSDFPIVFRFSQWKSDHYDAQIAGTSLELERILTPLADAGVSIFHPSTRRHWSPAFPAEGELSLAGWTRKITGRPVIAVGSVGVGALMGSDNTAVRETVEQRIAFLRRQFERGEFDVVAIGRALLADSEWVRKVLAGRLDEVRPYSRPPQGERLY